MDGKIPLKGKKGTCLSTKNDEAEKNKGRGAEGRVKRETMGSLTLRRLMKMKVGLQRRCIDGEGRRRLTQKGETGRGVTLGLYRRPLVG